MKFFNLLKRKNTATTAPVLNFARYTTDSLLILSTSVGQFTFDVADCDFVVNEDQILFLFSRKNKNGRVENFDLKIDNSLKNKIKNKEIIAEFNKVKSQKSSINS
jgi:hypothetical protein